MNITTLSALAEPTRMEIVELLRVRPRSVNDIARQLRLRQPQASKHLHTLSQAGIVSARAQAQKRIYSLQTEPFLELDTWLKSFERHTNHQLDKLDDYLKQAKGK